MASRKKLLTETELDEESLKRNRRKENNREEALGMLPRRLRTPIAEAAQCIAHLEEVWSEWMALADQRGAPKEKTCEFRDFVGEVFKSLWDDKDTDGDAEAIEFLETVSSENAGMPNVGLMHMAVIAASYCVQAMKAQKKNQMQRAWTYAIDAMSWTSAVRGHWYERNGMKSEFGKQGAEARHAENRALRSYVERIYSERKADFKSMDAAAQAIAGKEVPVTFRTVRSWIGDYNKRLRSAGRP